MASDTLVWPVLSVAWIVLIPTLTICLASWLVSRVANMSFYTYAALGVIGVPLHEIAHAIACLMFRMRIMKVALYAPEPETGRLGYVAFAYNPRSITHAVGLVVQGVAPLLLSAAIFMGLFPMPAAAEIRALGAGGGWFEVQILEGVNLGLALILGNLMTGIEGWLWAVLALLIGAYGIPSWSDVRLALRGTLVLALVLGGVLYLCTAAEYLVPNPLRADLSRAFEQTSSASVEVMGGLISGVTMVSVVGLTGVLMIQLLPALASFFMASAWRRLRAQES
ncbi:TPA: hypothetical protein ACKQHR_001523 [Pseudomonas aeruginosa]